VSLLDTIETGIKVPAIKINAMYMPSSLVDIWEEHVGSQEDLNVNHYIRRPR